MYSITLCKQSDDFSEWEEVETYPRKFTSVDNAKEWIRKQYRLKHLISYGDDMVEVDRDNTLVNRYKIKSDQMPYRHAESSNKSIKFAVVETIDGKIDFWGVFKDRESAEHWLKNEFHPVENQNGGYDALDSTYEIIELVNEGKLSWQ